MSSIVKPYGGSLNNLLVTEDRAAVLKQESEHFMSVTLSERQICDLELPLADAPRRYTREG